MQVLMIPEKYKKDIDLNISKFFDRTIKPAQLVQAGFKDSKGFQQITVTIRLRYNIHYFDPMLLLIISRQATYRYPDHILQLTMR